MAHLENGTSSLGSDWGWGMGAEQEMELSEVG